MCIRDRDGVVAGSTAFAVRGRARAIVHVNAGNLAQQGCQAVSYTHLRAHETVLDIVCRLLLEKKTKEHTNTRHP